MSIAGMLVCLFFASVSNGQEPTASDDLPKLIKTVEVLEGLLRNEAAEQIPVEIEGVIHACNPVHDSFFLHQGESPVYVIFPDTRRLKTGQRVVVKGRSLDGFINNMIVATTVDVKSDAADLVEPVTLKVNEVLAKSYDCEWVHLDDVYVVSAAVEAERITFVCEQYGHPVQLCIYGSLHEAELAKLIGAKVSVTGNLGVFSVGGELKGVAVNSDMSFVERTTPPEEELKLGAYTEVGSIWSDGASKAFRTRGIVNFVDEYGVFIEDSSGGTWLQFERPIPFLEPGFTVSVTGCRVEKEEHVDLRVKVVYVQYKDKLPPISLTPITELEGYESKRVRVRGRLIEARFDKDDQMSELLLENRDQRFLVLIPASLEEQSLNLPTARELLVTGTLTFASHQPYEGKDLTFRMYSPSFQEVEVYSRIGIWRNGVVQAGCLAGLIVLASCLLWGLRNRIADIRKGRRIVGLSAQLRSSYDAIRDGIVVVNNDGNLVDVNQKAREFFSLALGDGSIEEFHRSLSSGVINPDFIQFWEALNEDFVTTDETVFELTTPQRRILEVFTSPVDDGSGNATERIWVFYDVTERWRLQDSLLHAQKQEAVGRLAGGIAHDFNNYLTGITGNLFIAKLHPSKTVSEVSESIDAAQSAASRAAALVTNLLGFSQKTPLNMRQICVNALIHKMEMLLRPSISTSISLRFDLQDDLPQVHADPLQLEQVLLNICLNARDSIQANQKGKTEVDSAPQGDVAIPQAGREFASSAVGSIVVQTAVTRIDNEMKVRITVVDDGCGISQQHLDKIFEPFFTTKGANGTGLGLAMSHGIIKQHSGEILVNSTLGEGSEFRILLPTVSVENGENASPSKKLQHAQVSGRHVLVVDDESSIRSLVSKVLTAERMVVHTAANGEDAIQQLLQYPGRVDLVILDWKMPVRDGKQTLHWLKQELPDLPVLVCSGHIFELEETLQKMAHPPELVLQKPFRIQELTAKVRLAFAEAESSGIIAASNLESDDSAAGRASAESI